MNNASNVSTSEGSDVIARIINVIVSEVASRVEARLGPEFGNVTATLAARIVELENMIGVNAGSSLTDRIKALGGLDQRVRDLEERIEDTVIGQDVRDLESSISDLESKVDDLSSKADDLECKVDDLETMDESRVSEIALEVNQAAWADTSVTKALIDEDGVEKIAELVFKNITSGQAEEIVRNGLNEIMIGNVKI